MRLLEDYQHSGDRALGTYRDKRSGVGNLVRPTDLYLPPEGWWEKVSGLTGADLEQLGITQSADDN